MSDVPPRVGLLGGGVIGGGWAARFLLHGADVTLYDPDPDAPRKVGDVIANARRSLPRLLDAPLPAEGALTFVSTVDDAVDGAGFIQESAPERLEVKQELLARADKAAEPSVVIASSTSGLLPSRLQEGMEHPERLVVGHPFNPVYLLPLVEVCAGRLQRADAIERAITLYRGIGMRPLVLDTEIEGFVADRLLEALWREALGMVSDGVATASQIDDAIRFGAGLRWSAMGTFLVYRMAGGEAGMRHFLAQFGPALQWPWTRLTDVPELTDDFLDRLVLQSDEQAGGRTVGELEALRDDCLVAVMRGLRKVGFGAGEVLAEHEERLYNAHAGIAKASPAVTGTVERHDRHVAVTWDDGHRTEFHHFWLRDNCSCAECVHPQTRERVFDTFALDQNVTARDVVAGPALDIIWSDGHRSAFSMAWLREACSCNGCLMSRRLPHRHWGAELAEQLPEFDHADVMADDAGLLRFAETVWTTGVAFVRGVPTNEDELRTLARRFGHVRETNFGPDFHVEAMLEPNNVAYTSVELRPHTDLVNHESPPGIQFLHCFVADAPGGDSTLVDGFWVADRIRADDPVAFRLLRDVPIAYRFHDDTHDIHWSAPVIACHPDGAYREIRFNNALMAPLDVPVALVEPVYAALRRFHEVATSDTSRIVVRLRPGDVMVFHNRRILHGRTVFGSGGDRHLFGLYVDSDEWRSRIRVLRREVR